MEPTNTLTPNPLATLLSLRVKHPLLPDQAFPLVTKTGDGCDTEVSINLPGYYWSALIGAADSDGDTTALPNAWRVQLFDDYNQTEDSYLLARGISDLHDDLPTAIAAAIRGLAVTILAEREADHDSLRILAGIEDACTVKADDMATLLPDSHEDNIRGLPVEERDAAVLTMRSAAAAAAAAKKGA